MILTTELSNKIWIFVKYKILIDTGYYNMKKIHTYLLFTYLLAATIVNSANFQALDHRPDFINLSPQQLSQEHQRQASLGHADALVAASYINFNYQALNIIKGNNDKFYNVNNADMSGHDISLRLPNINTPVLLTVENVQNLIKDEDVITYTGYVAGDTGNFFTLSVSDEGVMAKINYGKYIYIITPLEGHSHKHSVAQLEKSLMIKDTGQDVITGEESTKAINFVEKSSSGSGHVEILFYYASDVYWPSLFVSSLISEMNNALSRSGISAQNYISSVGLKYLATTFSGQCKIEVLIAEMGERHGVFANLDQEMITYGADLAFTILGDLSASNCFPGQSGRVGGQAYLYLASKPFAVTAQAYLLGDLTALHEIGHNLGGKHSNLSSTTNGTASYARGKTFTVSSDAKQTIMGSYDTTPCDFTGLNSACERIDYFTNPSVSYSGVVLGDSTRNMKNWLNISMPVVSAYRGASVPPPNAPNPINRVPEFCFGFNSVIWTAQTGATEYKLYKSTSSSFTSPTLLYSGTSTSASVNVSSGTWYLRAQACNSSGCSAYSDQVTASYFNGCL